MRNIRTRNNQSARGDSGFRTILLLREVNALVNARIGEELAASGLTPAQITVVRLLGHGGELTMSEIGAEMHASPSTVAGIVDRLEAAEIVVRRREQTDRRIVRVAFTELGSKKALAARKAVDGCFAQAFSAIGDEELSMIESGLSEIAKALRAAGVPGHRTAAPPNKE
jgi:DNA-binding MarR family transcriptional regulator